MDRHQQTFLEEARELLADLEDALLAIEHDPDNADLVGRIFRAMHTMKGSSAMFGFDAIAAFTHDVENAFDRVREGEMRVTPELITVTLASRDHLVALLQAAADEVPPDTLVLRAGDALLAQLRALMPGSAPASPAAAVAVAEPAVDAGPRSLYRIRFRPPQNIFLIGANPHYLIEEVLGLGEGVTVEHADGLPAPEERNPEFCYSRWDVLVSTSRGERAIRDVFLFVEDESELRVEMLSDAGTFDKATCARLVEILQRSEDAPMARLREALVPPRRVEHASGEHPPAHPHAEAKGIQSIKVPSDRLDKLVNLVGELVIVQARLSQASLSSADPVLHSISEQVESLVWELRDTAMGIRMLPIGTTFGRFRRLVRDLSAELGKEIELVTEGEETELDKTVIERLADPLVHMIRNCIDHGIETPEERRAAGKPVQGVVRLSAVHSGANVHISIADDGRGLDTDAIRAKAVAQGLLAPDAQSTEQELFALIFAPGFSTAKTVTSVSGRGVGMDVVRRNIEDLRGLITVASTRGTGTTITLKLPLTLAIIEGLLIEVGADLYILPLSIVKECVELPSAEERRGSGGQLITVRGEIVPYVRLREFFEAGGPEPAFEYVVIVEVDGTRVGFAVDAVRGQHQTVIKALGAMYRNVRGVSGATILGDGTVALIVDVPAALTVVQAQRV